MQTHKYFLGKQMLCEVEYASINHAACATDDCVYIFGGMKQPGCALDALLVADPVRAGGTLVFRCVNANSPQPPPRFGHSMVAHNGALYVFGGYNASQRMFLCDIWKFQNNSKTWTQIGDEIKVPSKGPTSALFHTANIIENEMLVFGASPHFLWSFDLQSEVWTMREEKEPPKQSSDVEEETTGRPSNRFKHISGVWRSTLHIQGGCSDCGLVGDHWEYDTRSSTWQVVDSTGNSPQRRAGHVSVVINGCWLVHGGVASNGDTLHDTFEFSFLSSTWTSVDFLHYVPMPPSPAEVSANIACPKLVECDNLRYGGDHRLRGFKRHRSDGSWTSVCRIPLENANIARVCDENVTFDSQPTATEFFTEFAMGSSPRVEPPQSLQFPLPKSFGACDLSLMYSGQSSDRFVRSNLRTKSLRAGVCGYAEVMEGVRRLRLEGDEPVNKVDDFEFSGDHDCEAASLAALAKRDYVICLTMNMNRYVVSSICRSVANIYKKSGQLYAVRHLNDEQGCQKPANSLRDTSASQNVEPTLSTSSSAQTCERLTYLNIIPSTPLSSEIEAKLCEEYDRNHIFTDGGIELLPSSLQQYNSENFMDLARPHKLAMFFSPSFLLFFPRKSCLILGGTGSSNCLQGVHILFYHRLTEVLFEWVQRGKVPPIPLTLLSLLTSFLP